jgi:hypothetical protein
MITRKKLVCTIAALLAAPAFAQNYVMQVYQPGVVPSDDPALFITQGSPFGSWTFGVTAVDSSSTDQFVLLKNTNPRTASLMLDAFSGAAPGDFSASSTCYGVAVNELCRVSVKFKPTGAGVRSASWTLAGVPYSLTGAAYVPAPNLVVTGNPNPNQQFQATRIGSSAAAGIVFGIRNAGTAPGSLSLPVLAGAHVADFGLSTNCSNVPVDGTCTLTATFQPATIGTRSANFNLSGTGYALVGEALPLAAAFNPATNYLSAQAFGSVGVGASSTPVAFTYYNIGGTAGGLTPVVTGANIADFSVGNGCSLVSPGDSCAVTVAFNPKADGARSASLELNGSTFALTGSGVGTAAFAPAASTPVTHSSGSAAVGVSATPAVTLAFSNTGSRAGSFALSTFGGSNPGDFTRSTTCTNIAMGDSCGVTVSFTPTADGARSATLVLSGTTYTFSGTGVGSAAFTVQNTPSPSQTSSGAAVGTSASPMVLTFKNTGSKAGAMTVPALAGANPSDYSVSNTCSNVAIGADCAVSVTFTPVAAGSRSATLLLAGTTYTYTGSAVAYVAWDPATKLAGQTLANSNLTFTTNNVNGNLKATVGRSTGKYYWEVTYTGGTSTFMAGVIKSTVATPGAPCLACGGAPAAANYAVIYAGSTTQSFGNTPSVKNLAGTTLASTGAKIGDTYGFALDASTGTLKVYFAPNGGACVNHTIVEYNAIGAGNTWYPVLSTGGGNWTTTANFGATGFACPIPAGYSILQ